MFMHDNECGFCGAANSSNDAQPADLPTVHLEADSANREMLSGFLSATMP
jgi:hypothetical protein